MKYKILFLILFLTSCVSSQQTSMKKIKTSTSYSSKGFALIYDESLEDVKKLDTRSLDIYHKSLKRKSMVKITNPENGNSLIAVVKSNRVKFSDFYNSILSSRIAETLELDLKEPYVEIVLISKNSTFVAKKSKTFDEERSVAEKAPIDGIQINDLNEKKVKKKKVENKNFSYSIKVADFYYKDTAKSMVDRIKSETSLKELNIMKLSLTKYRVLIGPFDDIKSLKNAFEKMNYFNFENLEILNNA